MFNRRQFLASLSAFLVPLPSLVKVEPVRKGRDNFFSLEIDGFGLFTLADLETITGKSLFDASTDKTQCLPDDHFYKALADCQKEGLCGRVMKEVCNFGMTRAFGCFRKDTVALTT